MPCYVCMTYMYPHTLTLTLPNPSSSLFPYPHTLTLPNPSSSLFPYPHTLTHPYPPKPPHSHTPLPSQTPHTSLLPPSQVIWEYLDDGGLWQALPDGDSFRIEKYYSEQTQSFHLGDAQLAFQYNLNTLIRVHPRTKHSHRLKRTPFIEERPEGGCAPLIRPSIIGWGWRE